ncbi:translational activator for mitochondrial COX1 [Tulasnella sp. 403]|nr:translational activator for mitochondrial COX1 [Tulasnella sp. 403]
MMGIGKHLMATPLLRAALVRSAKRVASTSTRGPSPQRSFRHSQLALPYPRPSSRQLFAWARKTASVEAVATAPPDQAELFYPLSESPHEDIRARSQRISALAPCPVCLTHNERKHAAFECPDCGFPSHCNEEHWAEDAEHAKYCDRLREANEDEHDLRSGRKITEFEFNDYQAWDEAVSFAGWDLFWYTRGFKSIDSDRSRRHATKVLTYPITIASVLHEHSPHTMRNQRITLEGARSLAALRSNLHTTANVELSAIEKAERPPIRIFVLGARSESNLPLDLWHQIGCLFTSSVFHIYLIGPQTSMPANATKRPEPSPEEAAENAASGSSRRVYEPPILPLSSTVVNTRDQFHTYGVPSYSVAASPNVRIIGIQAHYHEVHALLAPFDPYSDVFFAFSPGFGFPSHTSPPLTQIASPTEWGQDIPMILDTKCALFVTGFSPTDVERDVRSLDGVEGVSGEFDWVLTPGVNPFGSEKWDIAEFDPRVMVKTNWGIWGIKGKRRDIREGYEEAEMEEDEEEERERYIGSPRY